MLLLIHGDADTSVPVSMTADITVVPETDTLIVPTFLGNTVVAVEHDAGVIERADWVVDMGPGAGHKGGRVVATGTPQDVAKSEGLTGRYLKGDLTIPTPKRRRRHRSSDCRRGRESGSPTGVGRC